MAASSVTSENLATSSGLEVVFAKLHFAKNFGFSVSVAAAKLSAPAWVSLTQTILASAP